MTQRDKLLFTPGPLTTSASVKATMTRDLGSRDNEFIQLVRQIRTTLSQLATQNHDGDFTTILMQGSGTFGVESVVSSCVAPDKKLLIIINGAYGKRIAEMARIHRIATETLIYPENTLPDLAQIDALLAQDSDIQMVAVVHCETTTGILNPIHDIGKIVYRHQRIYFVDAMSSFGAIPINVAHSHIHYLVSSSNKCIEGVPGFSFCVAHIPTLLATKGYARSLSLDFLAQYHGLEKDGQFRFTPPVQTLLAFGQALQELADEGGVNGRGERYRDNHEIILNGMTAMGFVAYIAPEHQSNIITTFLYPPHPNFHFETFYRLLSDKGFVIYPGKLTDADCFRIGNIGRLFPQDMQALLRAIQETIHVMDVTL
jgi:2-aminoethylphosphonate-pyruvate transaminase